MTAAAKLSRRTEIRRDAFTPEFTCRLLAHDETTEVQIRPLDVSPRGLGFLANQEISPGSVYWLELGGRRYRVELAYCNNHLGIDDLFRCGLFLREENGNLTDECRSLGLLAEKGSEFRDDS